MNSDSDVALQEADQLKLELQDIEKEMGNTDTQTAALTDKITQEEKQLEQLTQSSDAAKVATTVRLHIAGCAGFESLFII